MDLVGHGLVCSLGYDAVTACAAARAGLTRAAELSFPTTDAAGSPTLATGHPVPLLTEGFDGNARLIRLLHGALEDLLDSVPAHVLSGARLAAALALPAEDRELQGLRFDAPEDRLDYEETIPQVIPTDLDTRARNILERASSLAGLPLSPQVVACSTAGRAAGLILCEAARAWLERGEADLVLLAGVDSLVADAPLHWLAATRRLKDGTNPVGLSPGEAAAIVALTLPKTARKLGLPSRMQIHRTATATSATTLLEGSMADGRACTEVAVQASQGCTVAEPAWLILDHNGEEYGARDWGHALVRLRASHPAYTEAMTWLPAMSFGDVGCAFAPLALCMASRAFARGYAPAPQALVLASSDGAERAGCLIDKVRA